MRDVDGHDYIDALGEFTAGLYGHSHAVIRGAVVEALGPGLSLSSHTAVEAALAREIQRRFPATQLLRFTNSGTEANLLAFRVAYHGGVLAFGSCSRVNVPHEFVVGCYNDIETARALVAQHGTRLAAILVEPMLGAGGCIAGELDFLRGLRALADACGALLIFDEVMTSRLSFGGRQAQIDVAPDLTALGKYFGGGLSFGA